ncbi:MAG: hypothetical protein Q8N99_02310 [Nanoarchaeota archaeon]|nr:hypothetical protein [Nanoarchaeota archaeon]
MIIGVIGPNKFEHLLQVNEYTIEDIKDKLDYLAKDLAKSGHEILLTPDKDSVLYFIGKRYIENGGKRVNLLIPKEEHDYLKYLDITLGDIINCNLWRNKPARFNEESDIIVCVGFSGMALAEIGFSKYYNPKTIYIIKDFISSELPKELHNSLKIKYLKLSELKEVLKGL